MSFRPVASVSPPVISLEIQVQGPQPTKSESEGAQETLLTSSSSDP